MIILNISIFAAIYFIVRYYNTDHNYTTILTLKPKTVGKNATFYGDSINIVRKEKVVFGKITKTELVVDEDEFESEGYSDYDVD